MRFSPLVGLDSWCPIGEGGLLMDITGCQRLFGGETNLLQKVYEAVLAMGLAARVAIADTVGCAWAVAHYSSNPVALVAPGRQCDAMAPLPMAALRLDERTLGLLAQVGIKQVGHILPLPPAALRERFDDVLLLRIDQAFGRVWERVEPVRPVTLAQVTLELGGPVSNLEAIKLGVRNLLKKLLANLQAANQGVRLLELVLGRSDAGKLSLQIPLAYPSCDQDHLLTLLGPSLEKANMGFGVETLTLIARDTAPLQYTQLPLLGQAATWHGHPAHESHEHLARASVAQSANFRRMNRYLGELVDVLASRLGTDAVFVTDAVESHLPERAFIHRPASGVGAAAQPLVAQPFQAVRSVRTQARKPVLPNHAAAKPTMPDRPSLLFQKPQPLSVTSLSPEGPLMVFCWRGNRHEVKACIGPERISPQWWDLRRGTGVPSVSSPTRPALRQGEETHGQDAHATPNDPLSTRDYYKIQDQHGQWIWLYRQRRDGLWFVHGLWE
jgi:protein ImuB